MYRDDYKKPPPRQTIVGGSIHSIAVASAALTNRVHSSMLSVLRPSILCASLDVVPQQAQPSNGQQTLEVQPLASHLRFLAVAHAQPYWSFLVCCGTSY